MLRHPLRSRRAVLAGAAALAAAPTLLARPALAQNRLDQVRFSCDFRVYGGTSPFFYGIDAGYFRDAGIEARVDGSAGSADAVRRVASGAYEFGCADIATLVEFIYRNPGAAPKVIMPIYDRFAAAIVSLKAKGITSFEALRGKNLGTGQSDAPSRILPALARLKGINVADFNPQMDDVSLRDSMLLRGQVDAVVGFDYTVLFNLLGRGVRPEDTNLVYFADNGFNFYGQGLIVNPAVLQQNPDLVKRMSVAIARCWLGAAQNRDAAIDSVVRREALSDRAVELARQNWVLDRLILTPNVKANGFGSMDLERLRQGIAILAEGFQMTTPPTVEQVYDDRFPLPPEARRVP